MKLLRPSSLMCIVTVYSQTNTRTPNIHSHTPELTPFSHHYPSLYRMMDLRGIILDEQHEKKIPTEKRLSKGKKESIACIIHAQ